MKRILTLLMAAVMVAGTAGLAGAVEFKASGHMHLNFSVLDNTVDSRFDRDVAEDNFFAAQRFRPKLTMKAEGVTAVFEAQQQQAIWGSDWPMGGNPDMSIRIRQAYIDFNLPSCPVSLKVGYQQLSMPSIWGHPVLDARVGGVVANIPVNEQLALRAFWARPQHNLGDPDATPPVVADVSYNSVDLFGALLPLSFGTVQATPYLVYARAGADSDSTIAGANEIDNVFLGGVNLEILPTDALSIKVDGIVTNYDSDDDARDIGTGWMVAAAVDYEMPWGTPGAFGWYATGADDDGEGALFSYKTDGFGPSSWGFAGGNTFAYDSQISDSGVGTWAVGLQIADMSFVHSLKHTVRVLYARGTNDNNSGAVWTTRDSFIEANLDSTWSIYENLAAVVELGGLIPDLGSNTKAGDPTATPPVAGYDDDFAWKAQITMRFSF